MTQAEKVLNYMKTHGSITTKDAYDDLGITQLGRCLDDLEKAGHKIDRSEWKTVRNRQGDPVKVKNYKLILRGQQTLGFGPAKKQGFGSPA